ncbi:MAG TPA: universal stress protein [Alphaproteobacteria bacterium]|nr:universal stress protein [Alphaproteobacteria bacterium]
MFKKILVPVDLSDTHQQALDVAVRLASESEGEVTLLHVVEVITDLWECEEQEFYARLEGVGREHLARLGRYVAERGSARHEEVVFGNRAHEIVRYAMEVGADLIVLTSHRLDPENPTAGWGTVSHKVAILSQCPVLLVK